MELLEWAVLPWMQRRERISGQGEAACGGDAWPQRTGPPASGCAPQAGIRDDVHRRCEQTRTYGHNLGTCLRGALPPKKPREERLETA